MLLAAACKLKLVRNIAIGDIHGSIIALRILLAALDLVNDRLIFLGDYIDRGPDSRQVLATLLELSANQNHVFLRGNHDEWLLRGRTEKRWFKTWVAEGVGGRETLKSYGASSFDLSALSLIPDQHFDFLERTRLFFQTDYEIFVHASLSWQEPEENDPQQLLWRSFEEVTPHPSGKRIICGHTSQPNGLPLDNDYAVCIDTFCYSTGWLSALDVYSEEVVQANNQGETRRFLLSEMPH
jgi:serine/threonine protein phosphatase 1